ncbi:MAG: hypothetical protein COA44_07245 [Arcobacter sp.]|nr:MAG: hypothetical protein COA44_07245 [Arcobacter sp.]
MKELYGVGLLIAYFVKWPLFLGLPILVYKGLENNIALSVIWTLCLLLIARDIYSLIRKKVLKKKDKT